nr:hypothetical protein [Tanacetum cinerariifolium]
MEIEGERIEAVVTRSIHKSIESTTALIETRRNFPLRTSFDISEKRKKDDDEFLYNYCWVIIYINPLNLSTVKFGVDAAIEINEKHQVFTAASEDISATRQKLMLLVAAVK